MSKTTKKHFHLILLTIVILSGAFLRVYNFSERFVFNQDQARDAIIGLYSIRNHKLPLVGPPSSAGPFSFGPLYYYLIILFQLLIPLPQAPWIGFTLLSILEIFIFYFIGKRYGDPKLGIIAAAVVSFSYPPIKNSTDMLNTYIVFLPISLAILIAGKIKNFSSFDAALLGFFLGSAVNFHLQSLGTLILLPLVLLLKFAKTKKVKDAFKLLLFSFFGFILSFAPLIYFEIKTRALWTKAIINYALYGQNKFYIPVRWLTDLKDFWPQLWGYIITGNYKLGYLLVFIFAIALISELPLLLKKEKYQKLVLLMISFTIQIVIVRYYKGPRSEEYLVFSQPFLIIFTAWSLWILNKKQKYLFWSIALVLITLSIKSDIEIVKQKSQAQHIYNLKEIIEKQSQKTIQLYTKNGTNMANLPILYLFYYENKVSSDGTKIGTCAPSTHCKLGRKIASYRDGQTSLYHLEQIPDNTLKKNGFQRYTPKTYFFLAIYKFP